MKNYRNFIFDWDGTLADTLALHESSFLSVMQELRPDLLLTFNYKDFLGCPTREVWVRLGVTDSNEVEYLTSYKQKKYIELIDLGYLQIFEGVIECLQSLYRDEKNLFIVTGGGRNSIQRGINNTGIKKYINGVVVAEDVSLGKPNPESYLLCLHKYNLSVDATLVVEDSMQGIAAAHAAGLKVSGIHDPSIESICDFWFPNFLIFSSSFQKKVD